MKGYQLTFFTHQDRYHGNEYFYDWLMKEARRIGVRGATAIVAAEGFGQHQRRLRSWHFFELGDLPVEITMILSEGEMNKLLEFLRQESVRVFYVKAPIEFGILGEQEEGLP